MVEVEILQLIANYGFPAVIALLFYTDFRKVIKQNTLAIIELQKVVFQTHSLQLQQLHNKNN